MNLLNHLREFFDSRLESDDEVLRVDFEVENVPVEKQKEFHDQIEEMNVSKIGLFGIREDGQPGEVWIHAHGSMSPDNAVDLEGDGE